SYYLALLFRERPPVPYTWIPPPSSLALLAAHIAWLALAFSPFILIFSPFSKRAPPFANEEPGRFRLFAGGLTFAWIADVSVYSTLGGFANILLRVPTLASPFLVLILVGRLARKNRARTIDRGRFLTAYSAALLIVAVATFGLSVSAGNYVTSASHYEHADSGALWLYSRAPWVATIIADHNTQGQYSIVYAVHGKWFEPSRVYTLESYSHLVDLKYAGST